MGKKNYQNRRSLAAFLKNNRQKKFVRYDFDYHYLKGNKRRNYFILFGFQRIIMLLAVQETLSMSYKRIQKQILQQCNGSHVAEIQQFFKLVKSWYFHFLSCSLAQ